MNNSPTLSSPAFNTVKCLTDHLCYAYEPEYLAWLCTQQSFQVTSLSDKITIRLIAAFLGLNIYRKAQLGIDSDSLVEIVKKLNSFSHTDGFLYEKSLQKQCEIIIPQPIPYNSSWEERIAPIQRLHFNSFIIKDPLIKIGLVLLFIAIMNSHINKHILINISETDWSSLINGILRPCVQIENLPLQACEIFASIIPLSLIKKIQTDPSNYQLLNPEVQNDK